MLLKMNSGITFNTVSEGQMNERVCRTFFTRVWKDEGVMECKSKSGHASTLSMNSSQERYGK